VESLVQHVDAGRRTRWPVRPGSRSALSRSRYGTERRDERLPDAADRPRDDEVVPEVDEQSPVQVGAQVGGLAFAKNDLVDPGRVEAVAEVVGTRRDGPVQMLGQRHRREGCGSVETPQAIGDDERLTAGTGVGGELDSGDEV